MHHFNSFCHSDRIFAEAPWGVQGPPQELLLTRNTLFFLKKEGWNRRGVRITNQHDLTHHLVCVHYVAVSVTS